jgi:hypothetical protein
VFSARYKLRPQNISRYKHNIQVWLIAEFCLRICLFHEVSIMIYCIILAMIWRNFIVCSLKSGKAPTLKVFIKSGTDHNSKYRGKSLCCSAWANWCFTITFYITPFHLYCRLSRYIKVHVCGTYENALHLRLLLLLECLWMTNFRNCG